MKMYQNRDTGELLTREEMLKQWREDYDGDDPTNPLHYSEQYDEIEQPDGGDDKPPKLELGQVVQTRGIYEACQEDEAFSREVMQAFNKYTACNWGDLDDEDKALNDAALENGDDRILAAYKTSKGKLYIITEWDRSSTCIMFANEY